MKIYRGLLDPNQEYIDAQVDKLTGSEIEMYEKFRTTDGIKELCGDVDRSVLESRYAFMWNRELEQRIKSKAWLVQNAHDKQAAANKAAEQSQGALRAMQLVLDLNWQGRKTVKIADLIDAFQAGDEQ